jgi:hypothetical protein
MSDKALEQVEILTAIRPKRTFVDRGYRGHGVQTTAVYIAGQKRGLIPALQRDLRRRSAIEPMIGHMKTDGRLTRCALKGTLGDALHTVLCGCGHNIRMILVHLRAPGPLCRNTGRILCHLRAEQRSHPRSNWPQTACSVIFSADYLI